MSGTIVSGDKLARTGLSMQARTPGAQAVAASPDARFKIKSLPRAQDT